MQVFLHIFFLMISLFIYQKYIGIGFGLTLSKKLIGCIGPKENIAISKLPDAGSKFIF